MNEWKKFVLLCQPYNYAWFGLVLFCRLNNLTHNTPVHTFADSVQHEIHSDAQNEAKQNYKPHIKRAKCSWRRKLKHDTG